MFRVSLINVKVPIMNRFKYYQGGEYGTALHAAAYYGSTSVVQLLVDRGANPRVQGAVAL
jgi:ankyrin repeat protein